MVKNMLMMIKKGCYYCFLSGKIHLTEAEIVCCYFFILPTKVVQRLFWVTLVKEHMVFSIFWKNINHIHVEGIFILRAWMIL